MKDGISQPAKVENLCPQLSVFPTVATREVHKDFDALDVEGFAELMTARCRCEVAGRGLAAGPTFTRFLLLRNNIQQNSSQQQ